MIESYISIFYFVFCFADSSFSYLVVLSPSGKGMLQAYNEVRRTYLMERGTNLDGICSWLIISPKHYSLP